MTVAHSLAGVVRFTSFSTQRERESHSQPETRTQPSREREREAGKERSVEVEKGEREVKVGKGVMFNLNNALKNESSTGREVTLSHGRGKSILVSVKTALAQF